MTINFDLYWNWWMFLRCSNFSAYGQNVMVDERKTKINFLYIDSFHAPFL